MRLSTLARAPGFRGGAPASAWLEDLHRRGRRLGLVERRRRHLGQLVYFRDPRAWFGGPTTLAFIDRAPTSEGLAFVLEAFDAARADLDDTTFLQLAADDEPLRVALQDRGLGIDAVVLGGDPIVAAARLGGVRAPIGDLRLLDAAGDPALASEIATLHRDTFSREPQYCWFGAYPLHLESLERDILAAREGQFALLREGRLVGHVGVDVREDPCFGRTAGLELVLAPELRGLGLARWIYAQALAWMNARAVLTMKGGTAQPAVLHLARRLGRPWVFLNLRRKVHFEASHFTRFSGDP